MSRALRRACGLAVALLLAATAGRAHPIHASFAEADFNRDTGRLEVALRVFADDLEAALSARAGRPVSLERTPAAELDLLLRAYLASHFTVRAGDAPNPAQRWVGRELRDRENEVWLYFDLPLAAGPAGARLAHRLLTDQFADQVNSVRVRDGRREVTLVFPPGQGEQVVVFPATR